MPGTYFKTYFFLDRVAVTVNQLDSVSDVRSMESDPIDYPSIVPTMGAPLSDQSRTAVR